MASNILLDGNTGSPKKKWCVAINEPKFPPKSTRDSPEFNDRLKCISDFELKLRKALFKYEMQDVKKMKEKKDKANLMKIATIRSCKENVEYELHRRFMESYRYTKNPLYESQTSTLEVMAESVSAQMTDLWVSTDFFKKGSLLKFSVNNMTRIMLEDAINSEYRIRELLKWEESDVSDIE